jgi:RES domain-containing protein
MGQVKNYLIECESRGFYSISTCICADCVQDEFLSKVVNDNLEFGECNYCNSETDVAPFDTIMERITQSIRNEYSDAQDIDLPWVEGEYLYEGEDINEIIAEFDPGWPPSFRDDIEKSLVESYWIHCPQGKWYTVDKARSLAYDWQRFKDQVMYKTRYLFLSEPNEEDLYVDEDSIPVNMILDVLGKLINKLNLICQLDPGTTFFRVRASKGDKSLTQFSDVGVAPRGKAGAGRMNPAGIPYLYLALDEETAVSETINRENTAFYLATFKLDKQIKVLDLAKIPPLPSKLNPNAYDRRCELQFIKSFQHDISMPIKKDGREHIEYVPTQIISEYMRHRFRDNNDQPIDGVLYPSARNKSGCNLALFVSDNDSAQKLLTLTQLPTLHQP